MRGLSISAAWEEAKAILARDGRLYLSVALALIVLPQVIMAVVGSPVAQGASSWSRVVYVAVVMLGFVAQIAMCRLAIGPAVSVGEAISLGLVRLVPVFLLVILVFLVIAAVATLIAFASGAAGAAIMANPGTPSPIIVILLLVLSIAIFAILQLVVPLAAAETGNPLRLASRTLQLARGHYLKLLGFVAAMLVGLGLVLLAAQAALGTVILLLLGRPNPGSMAALVLGLVAGLLQAGFTTLYAVMLARIYLQLSGRADAQAGVPNSGS